MLAVIVADGVANFTMQKEYSSSRLHAWLAWSLLFGIGFLVALFVPVCQPYDRMFWSVVQYLTECRDLNFTGSGASDYHWILFFFTVTLAMYRITQSEIKKDSRGLVLFLSGLLCFGLSCRLMDFPRLACLGLPMMMYGGSCHIFGQAGKRLFIPSLILLLIIPFHQITWLEQNFFFGVEAVLAWSGRAGALHRMGFLLCNDIYVASVLRDSILSLLLLFFLTRMSAKSMGIISLCVLSWSYVAALIVYALACSNTFAFFRDLSVATIARCFGWIPPMALYVFEIIRNRRRKLLEINPGTESVGSFL